MAQSDASDYTDLVSDLRRFFVTAHLLEPAPQKLGDELLRRLESILSARAAGGCWAIDLQDMLIRILPVENFVAWMLPALGLFLEAERPQVAAAAICALAALVTPPSAALVPQFGRHLWHRSWTRLPACLATALAQPAVIRTAVSWDQHSVALAACFAISQALHHHGGKVPHSGQCWGLWPALPLVAEFAAAAAKQPAAPGSLTYIYASVNLATGLGLLTFPAEMKRDMNLAAWRGLTKCRTIAAVLQILAACVVAFAHVLQREAQQSPHSNLARVSNPYFLMHEIVSSAAEATYSVAGYAEPAPLERPAARAFLAAVVRLLQAAAQPEVHPEPQADVAELMFKPEMYNQAASALCVLPADEQLSYISSIADIGRSTVRLLPGLGAAPARMALPVCFHSGLVCAMALFHTSAYRAPAPPTPTLQQLLHCTAYLTPLLRWMLTVPNQVDGASLRAVKAARTTSVSIDRGTTTLDNLQAQIRWVVTCVIRSMSGQLADGMKAALGKQQQLTWALAAADAGVPQALSDALVLGSGGSSLGSAAVVPEMLLLGNANIQAALLGFGQAIAAAPVAALPADAYAAAVRCTAHCVGAGMWLLAKWVPPVADVRFAAGDVCSSQSISRQLSASCSLLSHLATQETVVQPGTMLAAEIHMQLLALLQGVTADSLGRLQLVVAGFAAVCDALAAVIQHGRGCRSQAVTMWQPSALPASAVQKGPVPAALAKVRAALAIKQTAAASGAGAPAPSADAVSAAEAAAAALLAEEEGHKQQAAKRQAKAAKKARQRAKKAVKPVRSSTMQLEKGHSGEAGMPEPAVTGGAIGATAADAAVAGLLGEPDASAAAAAQLQQVQLQGGSDNKPTSEAAADEADWTICPLSKTRMRDPVVACDAITYEREAIRTWLQSNNTSPSTGAVMEHKRLVPNHALRNLLAAMSSSG